MSVSQKVLVTLGTKAQRTSHRKASIYPTLLLLKRNLQERDCDATLIMYYIPKANIHIMKYNQVCV